MSSETPNSSEQTPDFSRTSMPLEGSSIGRLRSDRAKRLIFKAPTPEAEEFLYRLFSRKGFVNQEDYGQIRAYKNRYEQGQREGREPVAMHGEALSREAVLANNMLDLLQAENPQKELIERTFAAKIEPHLFQQISAVLSRTEGTADLAMRFAELQKMLQQREITQEAYQGIARAFIKDDTSALEFLQRFAERKMKRLKEIHGEGIPREALEDIRQKLYTGFVSEAEKLRKRHEGKEIPVFEIQRLQEGMAALPRQLQLSIQNQIGALALEDVEGAAGRAFGFAEIKANMRILFGEELVSRLTATYELYKLIFEEYKKIREERTIITSRPGGRPLFTRANIDAVYKVSQRWWLSNRERLTLAEKTGIQKNLETVRGFLGRYGDMEMKERVREDREREQDAVLLRRGTERIFDVNLELAEERGGFEMVKEGLEEQIQEVNARLREALREFIEVGPFLSQEIARRVLRLDQFKARLEAAKQSLQPEAPILEKQIPVEVIKTYSPAGLEKKIRLAIEQAVVREREAAEPVEKRRISEYIDRLRKLQEEENYIIRLAALQHAGAISPEERKLFMVYIEAGAQASEIEAKEYQAYRVWADDVDTTKLTPKQKKTLEERKAEATEDETALRERAANLRMGNLKGIIE
jgi:hypothetical protein